MHKYATALTAAIIMLLFSPLALPIAACSPAPPAPPGSPSVLPTPTIMPPTRTIVQQATAEALDVRSAVSSADIVFRGHVRDVQEERANGLRSYTFAIDTLWKGNSGAEISVVNIGEFSDCRQSVNVPFAYGKSYIIYAARSATGLAPMEGSREAEAAPREDAILGPGLPLSAPTVIASRAASETAPPPKPSPKPALFLLLLISAVIVACLAMVGAVFLKR